MSEIIVPVIMRHLHTLRHIHRRIAIPVHIVRAEATLVPRLRPTVRRRPRAVAEAADGVGALPVAEVAVLHRVADADGSLDFTTIESLS